jgi:sodium-coupled neutral amino acid transporter 7/8
MFAMLYVAFLTVYEHYKLDEETIDSITSTLQAAHMPQHGLNQSMPAPTNNSTNSIHKHIQWFEPLAVVPVLCFAYQTHEVIVPVYACMKERAIGSFMKASIFGLVILFFLYNLVGAFGYLTFGERVGADIMSFYDAKDPVVVVGIVALVIKFITTYPPLMFCGRSALDGLYGEFRNMSTSEFKSGERTRRYIITTIWFVSSVAIAVFAPDISVTLQLLGSMASINVFVFPGMCLVSLTRHLRRAVLATLLYFYSALLIIFGVFIFILELATVFGLL